jgi:hypothetical protein
MLELATKEHRNMSEEEGESKGRRTGSFLTSASL